MAAVKETEKAQLTGLFPWVEVVQIRRLRRYLEDEEGMAHASFADAVRWLLSLPQAKRFNSDGK